MTLTLDLPPETEARLIARATAHGISVERYLELLIESKLATETEQPGSEVASPQAWLAVLEQFCNNPDLVCVPPLSDEAISRESIYRERENSQL